MAEEKGADVEELKQLLAGAKRPRVQEFIRLQIETLEREDAASAKLAQTQNDESLVEKPVETGAAALDAEEKVSEQHVPAVDQGLGLQPLETMTRTLDPYYITLSSFGWDQEVDRVKIYISLEGASKDKIVADFKANSFEVKIHDINGKNYRCGVAKLNAAIVPETSVIAVKPKRIIVTLRKANKSTWSDLKYKEDKLKNSLKNDKDPMAGVMDLMKNMYEEGDDETKRTIAKAWSESRSGKRPDSMF